MSGGSTVFSYNTTYEGLLQSINHYYENGNGWHLLVEKGLTPENAMAEFNSIPNHHVIANADGTYRLFTETKSYGTIPNSTATGNVINSNVQSGTNSAGNVMTVQAPAQTAVNQQGQLTAQAGMGSTGKFIAKSVVPAVFATGVGISLGKTIDSALYNANPNFWDTHGMSSLNPATWASITQDMSDTTGGALLATAFNMIFGIDPNGNVQMYGDETAVAYLALYMQRAGMFTEGYNYELPDDFPLTPIGNVTPITSMPVLIGSDATFNYYLESYQFTDRNTSADATSLAKVGAYQSNNQVTIVVGLNTSSGHLYQGAVVCKRYRISNGQLDMTYNISAGSTITGTYPCAWGSQSFTLSSVGNIPLSSPQGQGSYSDAKALGYMLAYLNAVPMPSLDGTGTQTGATLPQLNDDMTVDDVLTALRQQYPDIFNNAITNDVVQPDGSVKTYTYVPIAYPQATSATDTHPTGDGQQSSQANPYYDPTSSVQNWDWVWDLIDAFDTDWADDYQYDEDGGDGSTPTPVVPTGSASALWKIYNPSQSQLDAFGSWLWSSDFVDQLKKLFNDPMQSIIGLHKVFVTPPVSGSGAIKVGYLTSSARANYVSGQYVDVDCGSVILYEYFGNVFDYINTRLRLYLPFIGIVDLDINDAMRGTVSVKYHVDVLTGACLAEVSITRDGAGGVLYTFSGNCAVQYPVSSGSYVGIVTGLLGIAGGVAGTIASGGALAPMLMGAGASVGHMHADVKHSGNISSNAGAMGIKKPYIIIERPQTKMPTNGVNIEGLPENQTYTLGSLHGYVKVKKAHFDGIPCTSSELEKIKALLENGVYIP